MFESVFQCLVKRLMYYNITRKGDFQKKRLMDSYESMVRLKGIAHILIHQRDPSLFKINEILGDIQFDEGKKGHIGL